jgi:hypothetical protein
MQKVDHNIDFWEKCQIVLPKIAENCDHKIDPQIMRSLSWFLCPEANPTTSVSGLPELLSFQNSSFLLYVLHTYIGLRK